MKKMILTAIVMVALGGVLSAQTTRPVTRNNGTNKNSSTYVDANKNNVCDNFENNTRPYAGRGQQFRRGGGCGVGNRSGRGNGQCRRGGGGRS
ncbi:MAG: hypothetical protein IPH18_10895 [Chitinophagaceae bacterium]|nr:hypothetical protein [Chitinophagaceae bacterium]